LGPKEDNVLTITNKIRTIIALAGVGTALASAGSASAATTAGTSGPTVMPASATTIVAGEPNGVAQDGSFRRIKVELVDNTGRPLTVKTGT
jgi:hypothetical protein